ncbi:hypothetical protein BU15DRAFT_79150 [Melanogaster broomeanus]|nr:hypothetical protein BU15DRAFT_79150 [Melanogaster broomeanus]
MRLYGVSGPTRGFFDDDLPNAPSPHYHVISRISGIIKNKFGAKYDVKAYGSTVYMRGFSVTRSTPKSKGSGGDLDLVVLDFKRPEGFSPKIKTTWLPVKLLDQQHQISIDINVNNRLGLFSSYMLRTYCDLLPGLRSMIAAIKLWAHPHRLNRPSPERGHPTTFGTYALTLMTLGWLQSRGLAPNLQVGLGVLTKQPGAAFWIRASSTGKNSNRVLCDVRFRTATIDEVRPPLDLRATMLDWFHFWGYEYKFKDTMLDIKNGGIRPRHCVFGPSPSADIKEPVEEGPSFDRINSNLFGLKQGDVSDSPATKFVRSSENGDVPCFPEHDGLDEDLSVDTPNPTILDDPICVVDPFNRNLNVTKNISGKVVKQFQAACQTTWDQANKDVPMHLIICGFDAFKDVEEPLVALTQGTSEIIRYVQGLSASLAEKVDV